jgi:hypothetical protein
MKLCREYIIEVSNEANQVCTENGKKTISSEFFYQALRKKGLEDQITELKKIEDEVNQETNVSFIDSLLNRSKIKTKQGSRMRII